MTIAFRAECPICRLAIAVRSRASFAYVDLEAHLSQSHQIQAVRLVDLTDRDLAKSEHADLVAELEAERAPSAAALERERAGL